MFFLLGMVPLGVERVYQLAVSARRPMISSLSYPTQGVPSTRRREFRPMGFGKSWEKRDGSEA
jgi:hypothetical protein